MKLFDHSTLHGRSGERGFSLIEGMVASAILGTGLLALAAMQGIAMVKNVDANELTRMTGIASDILERVQFNRKNAVIYNGIDTQSPANCNGISAAAQPQARGDCLLWSSLVTATRLENIKGAVTVSTNLIGPPVLGQRTVTVTLTWTGSQNADSNVKRSRSLTIDRIIAPE